MADTYSASGGAGIPPLTISKDEDGNVVIDPIFAGVRLTKDAAKDLAKYLIAAHKPDETTDGEAS